MAKLSLLMSLKIQIKLEANQSFSDEVQLSSEAMGVYELQARQQDKSPNANIAVCTINQRMLYKKLENNAFFFWGEGGGSPS